MSIERAPIDVQNDARDLASRPLPRWHQAREIGDHMIIIQVSIGSEGARSDTSGSREAGCGWPSLDFGFLDLAASRHPSFFRGLADYVSEPSHDFFGENANFD